MPSRVLPLPEGLALAEPLGDAPARAWRSLAAAAGISDCEALPWDILLGALSPTDASQTPEVRRAAHELRMEGLLPPFAPFIIQVEAPTGLEDPAFRLRQRWTLPPSEPLDEERLVGPWYRSRRRGDLLLSAAQWDLLQAGQEEPPASSNGRLRWWAEVRPLAIEAGALLDPYLRDEGDVVAVDAIQPSFEALEDGGLRVHPSAAGLPASEFQRLLGADEVALSSYSERLAGGARRRYVLSDRARDGLGQVLRHRSFSRAEAAEVLERPHRYFDPAVFDLSAYSDRVIGIGQARYRANRVFAGPIREPDEPGAAPGWTEGVPEEVYLELVDDHRPEAEPVLVTVTREEDRTAALDAARDAIDEDRAMAWIEGRPVRASAELVAMLEDLPGPSDGADTPEISGERPILIIIDNVDSADFGGSEESATEVPEDWAPTLPAGLSANVQLYPYQEDGFRWLAWRQSEHVTRARGGLLADDMGLGKTLQVLCLLARRAGTGTLRPSLIVAPVSLLRNWEQEVGRFIPSAAPRIVHLRDVPRGREDELGQADLVLTSYETLAVRDVELGRIAWQVVVCDEAQKIKNPSTRAAHAVKAMRADVRIAMTGTPVENSLDDLWSLVDFFGPGLLGSLKEFRDRYSGPRVDSDAASATLRERLKPVVLRRLKEDLLADLPALEPPFEHQVEMSDLQAVLYRRMQHAATQGDAAARLAAIQRLLQICAHPFLVLPRRPAELDAVEACPKLDALLDALTEVEARGEKALIFARWIELQWLIAESVEGKFGRKVEVLNGSVPSHRRQAVIDAFSDTGGFGALVLAPRACGVGLNITAANHVFHYTREWNPAVEAQATDRVHRIGQDKSVFVHFFSATLDGAPTADAALARILGRKQGLIRDFVQPMADRRVRLEDFQPEDVGSPDPAPLSTVDLNLLDPVLLLAHLESLPVSEVRARARYMDARAGLTLDTEAGWSAIVDEPEHALETLRSMRGRGVIYLRSPAGFLLRRRLKGIADLLAPEDVGRRVAQVVDRLLAETGAREVAETEPAAFADEAPEFDVPEWLQPVADAGHQRALLHLDRFGHLNEGEAVQVMGDARAPRKFARRLEQYVALAPFGIRVEMGPAGKTWVKE